MRALALAALLAGCSYALDPEGTACTSDTDCAAGYACEGAHCRVPGLHIVFESLGGATGTVDAGGMTCESSCTVRPGPDAGSVTLTASGQFVAWRGACRGTRPGCTVAHPFGASVVAVFGSPQHMFVTSRRVTGDFGGIDGGDDLCNTSAADAGLKGHYSAWLSNSLVDAAARVAPGGWIRTDGRVFTIGKADLVAAGLVAYPPRFDEYGIDRGNDPQTAVFTGTDGKGKSSGTEHCSGWTSALGNAFVGTLTGGSQLWSHDGELPCSTPARLYCMRDFGPVAVRPPPLPHRLAFVTSAPTEPNGVADARCTSPIPGHTFLALRATSSHGALDRFDAGGLPWARTDGVQLFETPADVLSGTLLAPIERDPAESPVAGFAWLGAKSLTDPSMAGQSCADWSSGDPGQTGVVALLSSSARDWVSPTPIPCNSTLPVICLEP